ncbi:diheme cytochrome c [Ramlibacter sp. USB13]|uniref:Diheme cytochrome c n=1 Tax=Ramlibacter cellulosilyticus TaxID=2764187 RepID=A0A923MV27_9BURK|nr:diheme cytochrome c [Ramlibacter cellulosilyticus]MBC5784714.1 diheme cytochrome c [Ramlibacter cellulosilyticus]
MHARLNLKGCVAAALAVAAVVPALADERRAAVPLLPQYRSECAACHIAYPPGMLPAASWQRLMANLPQHFGTDASLDAATVQSISHWLQANAGTYKRVREEPPQDRITRSAWFQRKHDDVSPATWKLPAVKSPANCAACHTTADQGVFDEHRVRIPR